MGLAGSSQSVNNVVESMCLRTLTGTKYSKIVYETQRRSLTDTKIFLTLCSRWLAQRHGTRVLPGLTPKTSSAITDSTATRPPGCGAFIVASGRHCQRRAIPGLSGTDHCHLSNDPTLPQALTTPAALTYFDVAEMIFNPAGITPIRRLTELAAP